MDVLARFSRVWCPTCNKTQPMIFDVMKANDKNDHDAADIVCNECKSVIAAESGQKSASRGECGNRSTLLKKSKREERKGQSRRELSERLDVGRSEMFGGFSSERFWIDGLRLRAATKAATARKRPCHSGGCRTVGIVGG